MRVLRGFGGIDAGAVDAAVSIGNFDGVHRGHQAVIRSAVAAAGDIGGTSVVCTFDPHTRVFLHPQHPPRLLESLEQRIEAIGELGVDVLVVIPFDRRVARTPRETFLEDFLIGSIGARQLHVSKDFTFGAGGLGNVAYLQRMAPEHGFTVTVVPAVLAGGDPISSSRIRDAIAAGRLEEASELLGRPFALSGVVVAGEGRGVGLSAPTANLDVGDRFLPPRGVYVSEARVDGDSFAAVTNVGVRPTFDDGDDVTVETHLLEGNADLYGKRISVAFLKRLRDERRFEDADALAAQIRADVEAANRYFAELG